MLSGDRIRTKVQDMESRSVHIFLPIWGKGKNSEHRSSRRSPIQTLSIQLRLSSNSFKATYIVCQPVQHNGFAQVKYKVIKGHPITFDVGSWHLIGEEQEQSKWHPTINYLQKQLSNLPLVIQGTSPKRGLRVTARLNLGLAANAPKRFGTSN